MQYLAHTKDGKNFVSEEESQLLQEHLHNVSLYAKFFCAKFAADSVGETIGLLHDYGKFSTAFQEKIRGKKNKANHSLAGAQLLYDNNDLLIKLYGMLIAGHHTGLGNSVGIPEIMKLSSYPNQAQVSYENLACDFDTAIISKIIHKRLTVSKDKIRQSFAVAIYLKMLFSALIDADYTDTEEFCKDVKRTSVTYNIDILLDNMKKKLPVNNGSFINEIRTQIFNDCIKQAKQAQGLFSLTVPTGGGKTISSLAFALEHAQKHDLSRIIYVIPYTSIIEQNAKVIAELVGAEYVLEHHSNAMHDNDDIAIRWATENWDIPIVVTTNVQFFESFFSNRPSHNRKLHNVANSVVIFDEAQILPKDYLSPSLYLISELIVNYGVTAVLCSATQPEIEKYKYKDIAIREIAGSPTELANKLKRVKYDDLGKKTDEELFELLSTERSALLVVNSRKHAFALFNLFKETQRKNVFYLSTLIPPQARRQKIKLIKEKLKLNESIITISTQLIEAGVDIDFPVVYRSIAGIDSIIQAGGRANREGKLDYGQVHVFEPVSESGKTPVSLQTTVSFGKQVISLLREKAFELEGIKKYFELLYSTISENNLLDAKDILSDFELTASKFNFKTVSDKYKIIDDNSYSVIIPYDETSYDLVVCLRKNIFNKETVRKLSQYIVSIYEQEFSKLRSDAVIEEINGFYVLNNLSYYDEDTGLDIFTHDNKNAECYHL